MRIASLLSKMFELVYLMFTSSNNDMNRHSHKLDGIIEQPHTMGTAFDY